MKKNYRKGFTLIELIVVIGIISVLAVLGIFSYGNVQQDARNSKRKADLTMLRKVLESYKIRLYEYPDTAGAWRTSCANPTDYIPDVVNQGMIEALPQDPRVQQVNSTSEWNDLDTGFEGNNNDCSDRALYNCYYYRSNGADYKLMAHCTPEGKISDQDPFYDPNTTRIGRGNYTYQVSSNRANTTTW